MKMQRVTETYFARLYIWMARPFQVEVPGMDELPLHVWLLNHDSPGICHLRPSLKNSIPRHPEWDDRAWMTMGPGGSPHNNSSRNNRRPNEALYPA